ncbi:helix-turn-helix transcriptional regulator [Halobacillus halophilus]|uniref:helix-turn-helix transcriptional regulator n=1 Tax=Halobacillus halophilus TaxID=1570 RepID=UPI001CD42E18|nr:helix-turn-helix domain-containing protein [Halobacillus halophilus]MCA1011382.1 helix-turn-helix domain-containing protein [Halobacillus halophilus]
MNTNKLKEIRKHRGMSISELSRRTELSRMTIYAIEKGSTNPTLKTVTSICKVLDKKPCEIFFDVLVNHEYQKADYRG